MQYASANGYSWFYLFTVSSVRIQRLLDYNSEVHHMGLDLWPNEFIVSESVV